MNVDDYVASTFPLLPAPQDGELEQGAQAVSYLAARNGLWRRVNLAWVSALLPICTKPGLLMPYGALTPAAALLIPAPGRDLWGQFLVASKLAFPNECAAALVWNTTTSTWRYAQREAMQVSASRIDYREVELEGDEILVVDIHSHGAAPAFFSRTDDRDDAGSMKLSAVFGSLNQATPSFCARLNLLDQRLPVEFDHEANWSIRL